MTWAPHQERFPRSIDGNENLNRQLSVHLDGRLTQPLFSLASGGVQVVFSIPGTGAAVPGVFSGIDQAFMNGSE